MSEVENTLRMQREIWREVSERTANISSREFPPEAPKRILLFGVGSSFFASKLTAFSLLRAKDQIRVPVIACASPGVGFEVMPAKGDWAFALSHRGKTASTLQALETCTRAGAFTLLVSGQGAAGAQEALDQDKVRYYLPTSPQEKVEPHTMSVSSAVCAITSLLLGNRAVEEWEMIRTIGDPSLDVMRSRVGEGPSCVVGEWEGEWLAHEGALKLMEMAHLPVRSFGSEEYFHGPKASVGANDRLWHVCLGKDPRNKDLANAAFRIDVRGYSPLAWVPALVELQWAALAVALNRGVNPDGTSAV